MLLVSGLKLVNVPTLAIGIVLLSRIVVLLGAWLSIRLSGRTLREVSGEFPTKLLTDAGRPPRRRGRFNQGAPLISGSAMSALVELALTSVPALTLPAPLERAPQPSLPSLDRVEGRTRTQRRRLKVG